MKYGDITFIEKWNPDGTHDRIIIDVANGPKFLISAKVKKGSMSFGIIDIRGVSIKSKVSTFSYKKFQELQNQKLSDK